jgi:phage-related protein
MTPGFITLLPLLEKAWTRFEPLALSIWKVYQAVRPMNTVFAVFKGLLTGGVTGAVDAFKDRFAMIEVYIKKGLNLALEAARKYGSQLLDWAMKEAAALEKQVLKWASSLVDWVLPQIPKLMGFLMALGGSLISWIVGEIPVVTRYMLLVATAFVNWVLPIIPVVLAALTRLATKIIDWAVAEIPLVTAAMLGWASSLVDWVLPQVPKVLNALGRFGTQVLQWVEKEAPILTRSLLKWTEILAGWIIPAIPGVIKALEVLGAAIVNWGVTRLPVLIGNIVVGIGRGFGVNLRGPVSDLLKIFDSLVSSIRSTVLPAFFEMTGFLSTDLMPIIDRLANFIANTLIPTAADLAAFIMTTVVPAFVRAADLLGLIFGPSLTLIGSIIRNELLPALSDSWTYFDGKYMPTVRDLAAALGDKLAEGIRLATDKFEAAIPKLDDFYKKIEPIVGKALDLYKAISPISIALDVLKGFLEGGLQGGFGALEQHVVDLGKVFGLDLQPVIDWFNDTVVKDVIPTLKEWARIFIEDWWPKIRDAAVFVWQKLSDLWTFISTKIWPPFKSFLDWLGEQWGKVGKSIGETWETTIKPALKEFIRWISEVMWPKLRDEVFPWIEKHVKPILETAFGIIADHIIPDLGKFVDLVLNHVIPALVGWWGVLFTLFNPFIDTAGKLIGNLLGNTKDLKDPVSKAMDVFKNMADTFKTDVIPVLERLASIMHTIWWLSGGWAVELAIGNLGGDWLTQKIAELEKAANPSQARLEQYMKDHPNYDPNAAGNAPKKASGDRYWRGGLVEVGDAGMELIRLANNRLMLATRPMVLNLGRGSEIYNAQQTQGMFHQLPASAQQIHQMYQNSYSNASTWDNSTSHVNSHNTQYNNYYGQGTQRPMSFGMHAVWYGRS